MSLEWFKARRVSLVVAGVAFVGMVGAAALRSRNVEPSPEVAGERAASSSHAGADPERPSRQPRARKAPPKVEPGDPGNADPAELCAAPSWPAEAELDEIDKQLQAVIAQFELMGDPRVISREPCVVRKLASVNSEIVSLGKDLFFSKSLGGDLDSACVSCHHPRLGGADARALPIGVGADDPDMLGPDRSFAEEIPIVPRNSPTTFNAALLDKAVFWDGRVAALEPQRGIGGSDLKLSTPDTRYGVEDENAGANLLAAQSRQPLLSPEEMLGDTFGKSLRGPVIREKLAARLRGEGPGAAVPEGVWLRRFEKVCRSDEELRTSFREACEVGTPEALITDQHVAYAIGEYERSQIFVNTPWRRYVLGDVTAINQVAKQGALFFYRKVEEGGGDCAACHLGDLFTDEKYHAVAFPQIGPGKDGGNDLGRAHVTGNPADNYHFRTPTLLNLATSAPYGHAGTFANLRQVIKHYASLHNGIDDYFNVNEDQLLGPGWCQLPEFADRSDCASLFKAGLEPTLAAWSQVQIEVQANESLVPMTVEMSDKEVQALIYFMDALNDPCTQDASCLEPWLVDTSTSGPDGNQLNFDHVYPKATSASLVDTCAEASRDNPAGDTIFFSKAFSWLTAPIESFEYLPDGKLFNYFGFAYWRYVERLDFEAAARTSGNLRKVASVLSLELLTPAQRARLYELAEERSPLKQRLEAERSATIAIMHGWRNQVPTSKEKSEVHAHVLEAYRLEAEVSLLDAAAYAELRGTVTEPQFKRLLQMRSGRLDDLPLADEVLKLNDKTGFYKVGKSKALAAEQSASALPDGAGELVDEVASKFVTWMTGSKCKNDFLADGRIANLFGFPAFRVAVRAANPDAASAGLRVKAARAVRDTLKVASRQELDRVLNEVLPSMGTLTDQYFAARQSVVAALMQYDTPEGGAPSTARAAFQNLGEAEARIVLAAGEAYGEIGRTLGEKNATLRSIYDSYVK